MPVRLSALFVLAALCGAGFAWAADGPSAPTAAAAPPTAPRGPDRPACPLPATFRPAFEAAARETGLPVALLVAVAEIESGLEADAVSGAGARGLLQLMPITAAELRVDADHPTANVLGGARYLRGLLDRFRSAELALAAYNAGPTAVTRAGGAPSGETLTYVANVIARWRTLVGCR